MRKRLFLLLPALLFSVLAGGALVFGRTISLRWTFGKLVRAAEKKDAAEISRLAAELAGREPPCADFLAGRLMESGAAPREAACRVVEEMEESRAREVLKKILPEARGRFWAWRFARAVQGERQSREAFDAPSARRFSVGAEGAWEEIQILRRHALPAFLDLMRSEIGEVRRETLDRLIQDGPHSPTLFPVLILGLDDPGPGVRASAALMLGSFGPKAAAAVPGLVRALGRRPPDEEKAGGMHPAPSYLDFIVSALGRIGPEARSAAPALIGVLINEDEYLDEGRTVDAIWRTGSAVVPDLVGILKAGDERSRRRAAEVLRRRLGPLAAEAVPELILALRDPAVRAVAAGALGEVGSAAREAVPALIDLFEDPEPEVRRNAVIALAKIGAVSPEVSKALVRVLSQKNGALGGVESDEALEGFLRLGPLAREAAPLLVELAEGKDSEIGRRAGWALAVVDLLNERNIRSCAARLESEDGGERWSALLAAERFGSKARILRPALRGVLEDPDPHHRLDAAEILLNLDVHDAAAGAVLRRSLEEGAAGPAGAENAARGLRALVRIAGSPDPDLLPLVRHFLGEDRNPAIQILAARALARFGGCWDEARDFLKGIDPAWLRSSFWGRDRLWREAMGPDDPPLAEDELVLDPESSQRGRRDFDVLDGAEKPRVLLGVEQEAYGFMPPEKKSWDVVEPRERVDLLKAAIGAGKDAGDLRPALLELLARPAERKEIRALAVAGLARIDPSSPEAAAAFRAALVDHHPAVRYEAAIALGARGIDVDAVVPILAEAAGRGYGGRQTSPAKVLGDLGPRAREAAPALRRAMKCNHSAWGPPEWSPGDFALRARAAEALWKLTGDSSETVRSLALELENTALSPWLCAEAARILGTMGPAALGAVPALRERLGDSDPSVREAAAEALKKIQG